MPPPVRPPNVPQSAIPLDFQAYASYWDRITNRLTYLLTLNFGAYSCYWDYLPDTNGVCWIWSDPLCPGSRSTHNPDDPASALLPASAFLNDDLPTYDDDEDDPDDD